jgi:hypothetical protein
MQIGTLALQDGAARVRNFIKRENRLPNMLKLKGVNSKGQTIEENIVLGKYLNLYYRVYNFMIKHGRWPNHASLLGVSATCAPMDFQNDKYSCGPASLSMASAMLFNYRTEKIFKDVCGTNTSGTTPERLISGAAKLGFKLTRINRNITAVNASLSKGRPIIAHIQTRPARCLGFTNDYGHYVLIKQVVRGNYIVNDPTMGENKVCAPEILDKATNGRNIHYYSVSLL